MKILNLKYMIKIGGGVLFSLIINLSMVSPSLAYWGTPEECFPFTDRGKAIGLFVQNSSMTSDTPGFSDIDINEILLTLQASYQQTECWKSYFRLNLVQLTATDLFVAVEPEGDSKDFDGNGFGLSAGSHGTLWFYRDWSIGAFGQGSWYADVTDSSSSSASTPLLGQVTLDEEITMTGRWDLSAGVQIEKLSSYGRYYSGVVLQLSQLELETSAELNSADSGALLTEESSGDYESELDVSLFLGGRWQVYPDVFLTAEAQAGARTAVGFSVKYQPF